MIYPSEFPKDKGSGFEAEAKVFNQFKKLENEYDIFYARRFFNPPDENDLRGKKPEYEIDFIVARPGVVMCIEVKGGLLHYDGKQDQWTQNSRKINDPAQQAAAAQHALVQDAPDLARHTPFIWALCTPDSNLPEAGQLPYHIRGEQLIDGSALLYLDKALKALAQLARETNPGRQGENPQAYEAFKNRMLQDIGFIRDIGVQIEHNNQAILDLTHDQYAAVRRIRSPRLLVEGPAGSGKTLLARWMAHKLAGEGKQVQYLCYNRKLASVVAREKDNLGLEHMQAATFHAFAGHFISQNDPQWVNENRHRSQDKDYWDLDIPAKLDECLQDIEGYDALIIDEAQDFPGIWLEVVEKALKPGGQLMLFADQKQNIFGRNTQLHDRENFTVYALEENCRNARPVVDYLEKIIGEKIPVYDHSPNEGAVTEKIFKSTTELQTFLTREIKGLLTQHKLNPNQILILLNTKKVDSSIPDLKQIGNHLLKSMDRDNPQPADTLTYSRIGVIKGLEADIVFILDTHKIPQEKFEEMLYTQASRARHRLYVLEVEE